MTLQENLKSLKEIPKEDLLEKGKIVLEEDEFLLKVSGDVGFMVKLSKDNSVPKAFSGWRTYYGNNDNDKTLLIKEEFRTGWKFLGLRHGMSTAWVELQHPLGFQVEINERAFSKIANKITMVNGTIVTPCYFKAALKNAELLVRPEDTTTTMYQIQEKILANQELREKFTELMIENFPSITFEVLI